MQLHTRHFGTIEVEKKGIINFPEGVPGFETVKRFVLLDSDEEGSPFRWLQGVDNTDLAFVLIDPRLVKPNYIVDVDDSEVEILKINDTQNVLIYSIVVVPEDISQITANLKAPILINAENKTGKQVVLAKADYPIRYYIIEELQKMGA